MQNVEASQVAVETKDDQWPRPFSRWVFCRLAVLCILTRIQQAGISEAPETFTHDDSMNIEGFQYFRKYTYLSPIL